MKHASENSARTSASELALSRHGHEVHIDEWVAPDACDDKGHLRAGKVLEWMDVVGALAASRYGRLPGVTASVDGAELFGPVMLGDRVSMRARVAYTSGRSIGIAVAMSATARGQFQPRPVLSGYMTFVVVDDEGRAAQVPAFAPQTPEEIALHREGAMRHQFHTELRSGRLSLAHPEDLMEVAKTAERREPQIVVLLRELTGRLSRVRRRSVTASRAPQASYVHKIEPVRAGKLNFHGTLYGGMLMRWLETTGTMSASAFLEAPMRLVGVHGLAFLKPVQANVFAHLHAIAAHSDDSTVTVLVRATSENPLTGEMHDCLRGFLSYSPIDESIGIPTLVQDGDDEAALSNEVCLRKALHQRISSRADTQQ